MCFSYSTVALGVPSLSSLSRKQERGLEGYGSWEEKNFTRPRLLWGLHTGLLSGFSPLLGNQRQQTPHTEEAWGPCLPPAQLPPRWFWNSLLNTECPWVLPEREGLSAQPHPVITTSGQFYLRNTTWICRLLTNPLGSFNPCPISPLNYHHIPSTSSLTSPSSVATVTGIFPKSNQIKHSPALYFSNALNFHNRGFSDSVGLHIWINLAPPWENPSWWGSWVQECTFSARSPGDGELAMFTFRGAFIAPEQYMKREVRDWEEKCPRSESRDQHRLLQRGFSWLCISNLGILYKAVIFKSCCRLTTFMLISQ